MSHLKFLLSLPIALAVAQGLRVESTPYATVTDERLQRPEAGDWLLYRRTYDGSGFSPRQQINTGGGGKDWPPEALSPRTKLLYVPANNNICAFLPKGAVPKPDARGLYVGYEVESIFGSVRTSTGAADHLGELQAWT